MQFNIICVSLYTSSIYTKLLVLVCDVNVFTIYTSPRRVVSTELLQRSLQHKEGDQEKQYLIFPLRVRVDFSGTSWLETRKSRRKACYTIMLSLFMNRSRRYVKVKSQKCKMFACVTWSRAINLDNWCNKNPFLVFLFRLRVDGIKCFPKYMLVVKFNHLYYEVVEDEK